MELTIDIFLIVLIFTTGLGLTLKNPKWGFFFLIALLPLMHKELFSYIIWDFLPIRVAILGIAASTFYMVIKSLYGRKVHLWKLIKNTFKDPFFLLLTLLWIVRLISIYNSESISHSIAFLAFYSLILFIYLFYKSLLDKEDPKFLDEIIRIYIIVGLFTGLFALLQLYLRSCCRLTVGGAWIIPGYTPRLGSTFWDVNHYGGFLITLIPITFIRCFTDSKIRNKLIYAIIGVFFTWLLFMTQSRSAWMGLAIGLLITSIIFYFNKFRHAILYMGLGVLLVGLLFVVYITISGNSVRSKIAQYMHYRLDSTDTHMMLLEGASEVFFNNFLIGAGYGGFDPAFRKTETSMDYFDREPKLREMKVPPHSIWGEVLGETGAVGIVIYTLFALLVIGSLIYTVYHQLEAKKKYIGIGILGSVISIYSAGIFYSYNMEFFWIAIFIGIGYVYLYNKKTYATKSVLYWWYYLKITPYLLILPITIFYILLKLGQTTLIDYDEAIYAKVAKNIVQSGEWINLHWEDLNEYWFEKPPLYMWLTAFLFKFLNYSSFAARLPSALFGIAGIILTYKFASSMYTRMSGIIASLILLSTVHYLYYSRNGMMDVAVTFFITATLYLFYLASKKWTENRYDTFILVFSAGLVMGLGVMTKAVIGLIPLPIITIYILYLLFIRKVKIPWLQMIILLAGLLATAGPWHLYSLFNLKDEFWSEYFVDHMLNRGLKGLGHEKPIFWFFEVVKVSFRIWLFPFILGVITLGFIDRKRINEFVLMGISILFVLILFSTSKDKLQWYIMPIYPFMAIVAARFIDRFAFLFNDLLKKEYNVNYVLLRSGIIFVVYLISVFYVVLLRERIYYPDFNKDKVALVKIHNEMFPIESNPDRKLYFYRIDKPVLLFYSDHKIKATSPDTILSTIDDAEPDESRMFLIPESLYYGIRDEQEQIKAPLVLDVKGASGEWMLIKSVSEVEVLQNRFAQLIAGIKLLQDKILLEGSITKDEKAELDLLNKELETVVLKLTDYGYSPY